MDDRLKLIQEQIKTIPKKPGVYVIYDNNNTVIYVGKAKDLVNRLRSHFTSSNDFSKSRIIREKGVNIKVHIVGSENEALLLEYSMIQEYQPYLNEQWRDDKTYPYLEVTTGEIFPRFVISRFKNNSESLYLGPFSNVGSMKRSLKYVLQLFPVADCKKEIHLGDADKWAHTCIRRRTKQCIRPCEVEVDRIEYRDHVNHVVNFLDGKIPDIASNLEIKMRNSAKSLQFEEAAKYRDTLKAINRTLQRQQVMIDGVDNCYVLSHASNKLESCICLSKIKDGRVSRQETKIIENDIFKITDNKTLWADIVLNFLMNILELHSNTDHDIKKFIVDTKQPKTIMKALGEFSFDVVEASSSIDQQLVLMNKQHAKYSLHQKMLLNRDSTVPTTRVIDLQNILNMNDPPVIIDTFDVSTLLGKNNVASCVRFQNGIPLKSAYRRFKIKTVDHQDDFASMEEAVYRRYHRVKNGVDSKNLPIPDLIVIDGGSEQLKRAKISLDKLDLFIPVIGLAKREEEIYTVNSKIPLENDNKRPGILLIRAARDEAHRFAVNYQRKLRQKEGLVSILDLINGIGPKRKQMMMKKYHTVSNIAKESSETLSTTIGISRKLASNVITECRKFVSTVDNRSHRRRKRKK